MKYFIAACMAVSCFLVVPLAYNGQPPNEEARMFGEFGRLVIAALSIPFALCLGLMPAALIYWLRQRKQPQ